MKRGDLTNKGQIEFIDEKSKNVPDPLVRTHDGKFHRASELELVEKAPKPINNVSKATIQFDDVMKLDVRACRVLRVKRVKNTDKLLELTIDTGFDKRVAITNLGEFYGASDMVNKVFPFVLNLPPTTIRGVESEAMIFAATTDVFDPDNNKWNEKTMLMELSLPAGSKIL